MSPVWLGFKQELPKGPEMMIMNLFFVMFKEDILHTGNVGGKKDSKNVIFHEVSWHSGSHSWTRRAKLKAYVNCWAGCLQHTLPASSK